MTDKPDALAELGARYSAFRARIADLPDAAYSETWLGDWNLSQLLAHMAGWYREISGAIARVSRGEAPAPAGVNYSDADSWNVKFASDARTGKAALVDWDEAFAGYREAAAMLDDSYYGIDPAKNRPRIGNRLLDGAGIHHFDEHQQQLESWLASRSG